MATEEAPPRRHHLPFEVEDLLLTAWVAGGSMALRRWAGPWLGTDPEGGDPSGAGLIVLGLAWAFLIVTRGPEDDDREVALKRRLLIVGPALPLLSLGAMAVNLLQRLRGGASPVTASGEPPWPGPPVARVWRRTAALPFMVVGDMVFSGSHEVKLLRAGVFDEPFTWISLLAVYAFSVVGPRIAAGASLSPLTWAGRLALFLAATWWSLRLEPGPP